MCPVETVSLDHNHYLYETTVSLANPAVTDLELYLKSTCVNLRLVHKKGKSQMAPVLKLKRRYKEI